MRVQIYAMSLLLSTSLSGSSAAVSAAAPAAPATTAPARPVPAAPFRPAPAAPGQVAPPAPTAPGQVPPGTPPVESGPTYSGTDGTVLPSGTPTNAFVGPNGQVMATNSMAQQFANTNAFGAGSNPFGGGAGFDGLSNQFGRYPNRFRGTNQLGFHFTNQFGTNLVLRDEGLTPQDRVLVSQIRKELLPVIRREQLPIHLASQNGVVTITGVALSAQQAQQLLTVVQQTPGVTSVNNQLRVNPNFEGHGGLAREPDRDDEAFSPHDRDLLRDLRGRMHHRHGEGGASESVHIIARNGVVTLTGFVGSVAEEQALVASAQSTPGVVRVDNDLQVRGQAAGQPASQTPGSAVGGANGPGGVSMGGDNSSNALAPVYPPVNPLGGSLANTNLLRR